LIVYHQLPFTNSRRLSRKSQLPNLDGKAPSPHITTARELLRVSLIAGCVTDLDCGGSAPRCHRRFARAAKGDPEPKAAGKLGLKGPLEVFVAAFGLWGDSLTAERDKRVDINSVVYPGSSQARG